jgi:hypothetical protein
MRGNIPLRIEKILQNPTSHEYFKNVCISCCCSTPLALARLSVSSEKTLLHSRTFELHDFPLVFNFHASCGNNSAANPSENIFFNSFSASTLPCEIIKYSVECREKKGF